MKRYAWLIAPALIVLYCCNAENKVLKNPEKTRNVVNAWLKAHPVKIDTVLKYIPGDTTTTLLISYDTAMVHDTVPCPTGGIVITGRRVLPTKTYTKTIHDTVQVTIGCAGVPEPCALLKGCQENLANNAIVLEEHRQGEQRNKLEADKWKFRFYALVTILGLISVIVVGIKVIKPRL